MNRYMFTRLLFAFVILFALAVTPLYAETLTYKVSIDGSPYIGDRNAPVTIIEFIDYQ